jgi:putative phosphoribosyl transferase
MTAAVVEDFALRDRIGVFRDRLEAGQLLAAKLHKYADCEEVVVLAVPAGGVPVGYSIAQALMVPLDVLVVRKVQIPQNTEAGFGAVTWDGKIVLNRDLASQLDLTQEEVEAAISKAKKNVQERLRKFRDNNPLPNLRGKVVVLVDDGLASGFTMLAAAKSVRESAPKKIVVAVPTASLGAIELLSPEVDEIVCLNIRTGASFAVAEAYENWYDLSDDEVKEILAKAD